MTEVHIYRAEREPATRFNAGRPIGQEHFIEYKPNHLLTCRTCLRRRPAKNLIAQVYYDGTYFFCAKGKGCNSPKAKPWFCTRHQVNHGPKTRYWSCREANKERNGG